MTKSRMTLLLIALPGAVSAAEPISAERAMNAYRQTFQPVREIDCPRGEGDEIVVCARPSDVPDPNRLPLPVAREPGEPEHLAPGEGRSAVGFASGCVFSCPPAFGISLKLRSGRKTRLKAGTD